MNNILFDTLCYSVVAVAAIASEFGAFNQKPQSSLELKVAREQPKLNLNGLNYCLDYNSTLNLQDYSKCECKEVK